MFSSALKLAELDDFLTPAQECTKAITEQSAESQKPVVPKIMRASKKKAEKAEVALYDCLACSGCVTSAEAVLVQQQSIATLIEQLTLQNVKLLKNIQHWINGGEELEEVKDGGAAARNVKLISCHISTQSEVALSVYYGVSRQELLRGLKAIFGILGIFIVHSSSIADSIYLLECCAEMNNLEERHYASRSSGPLISSHCPGWVCYAEKVGPASIIDNMSVVPSAMILHGLLAKSVFPVIWNECLDSERVNLSSEVGIGSVFLRRRVYCNAPLDSNNKQSSYRLFYESLNKVQSSSEVFHFSVQPCYDKKLEAMRPEYRRHDSPLVDLILATQELIQYLDELEFGEFLKCNRLEQRIKLLMRLDRFNETMGGQLVLAAAPPHLLLRCLERRVELCVKYFPCRPDLMIGQYISTQLPSSNCPDLIPEHLSINPLMYRHHSSGYCEMLSGGGGQLVSGRNSDYRILRIGESIQYIWAYGFRNIRNIISSTTTAKGIETMACPKGCLNGSGHNLVFSKSSFGDLLTQYESQLDSIVVKPNSYIWNIIIQKLIGLSIADGVAVNPQPETILMLTQDTKEDGVHSYIQLKLIPKSISQPTTTIQRSTTQW